MTVKDEVTDGTEMFFGPMTRTTGSSRHHGHYANLPVRTDRTLEILQDRNLARQSLQNF